MIGILAKMCPFVWKPQKSLLFTPGPTPIPERVGLAISKPLMHHRSAVFKTLFQNIQLQLQNVFQTKNPVLTLCSSGTGAMNATVCSIFSRGEKVITINGGKFGHRWSQIAKAYELNVIEMWLERGEPICLSELNALLKTHRDATAVLFQATETATGVAFPVQAMSQIIKKHHMLSICDGITGVGIFPIFMDQWEIDVLLSGSQKAWMLPPGLSFVALSSQAQEKIKESTLPKFYFNLQEEYKKQTQTHTTAWTPSISLLEGLQTALEMIEEEGIWNRFYRHLVLAYATQNAFDALKLKRLAPQTPSPALTAVWIPKSLNLPMSPPVSFTDFFQKHWGLYLAGGQEELKNKIFRLSHFAFVFPPDLLGALGVLELGLQHLGYRFEIGSSLKSAQEVFSHPPSLEHLQKVFPTISVENIHSHIDPALSLRERL